MNKLDLNHKICAQDGSEPDSSGRKITFEMATQTSTIELPKEENNETDDDKKMKLEGGSNGDVVSEEKKDMMEMSELK